jgi:hypothetical protein
MNTTDAVSAAVFQVHQLDCSLHIAIPLQDLVIFLTSLFTSPSHFIFYSPLQALFGTPTSRLRSSLRWDEESSEDEDGLRCRPLSLPNHRTSGPALVQQIGVEQFIGHMVMVVDCCYSSHLTSFLTLFLHQTRRSPRTPCFLSI